MFRPEEVGKFVPYLVALPLFNNPKNNSTTRPAWVVIGICICVQVANCQRQRGRIIKDADNARRKPFATDYRKSIFQESSLIRVERSPLAHPCLLATDVFNNAHAAQVTIP